MPPAYSKPVLKEEMVITLELLAQYLKAANLLTAIPAWPYDGSHYSMHPPPALHPAEKRLCGVPRARRVFAGLGHSDAGSYPTHAGARVGREASCGAAPGAPAAAAKSRFATSRLVRACQQGGISTSAHPLRIRYRAHAAWWAAARHWRPVAGVPQSAILRLCVGSHTPQPTVSLEISLSVVRI